MKGWKRVFQTNGTRNQAGTASLAYLLVNKRAHSNKEEGKGQPERGLRQVHLSKCTLTFTYMEVWKQDHLWGLAASQSKPNTCPFYLK